MAYTNTSWKKSSWNIQDKNPVKVVVDRSETHIFVVNMTYPRCLWNERWISVKADRMKLNHKTIATNLTKGQSIMDCQQGSKKIPTIQSMHCYTIMDKFVDWNILWKVKCQIVKKNVHLIIFTLLSFILILF